MRQGFRAFILLLLAWPCLAVTLTPAQQQAKEEGILLYKQHYNMPITIEKLLPAAEAGDTEAMVYLGKTYFIKVGHVDFTSKQLATAVE